jgi:hypothetical protein
MALKWRGLTALGVLLVVAVSCGGATPHTTPSTLSTTTTSNPSNSSSTSAPGSTTSTTPVVVEPLTAHATVNPDQGVAGTQFTFTVAIRGPGTGDAEAVQFGDGGTSGANAGRIHCGDTPRADRDSKYEHTYAQAGTYTFVVDVFVIGVPPSCTYEHVRATLPLVVAAPLSAATKNGAFLSPSKNIACNIDVTDTNSVRCATFSPPQLVTMNAMGAFQTCYGATSCELGNPAADTPVLAFGSATGGGPFQCLSTRAGMTCTIAGHKGFTISRSGIQQVD